MEILTAAQIYLRDGILLNNAIRLNMNADPLTSPLFQDLYLDLPTYGTLSVLSIKHQIIFDDAPLFRDGWWSNIRVTRHNRATKVDEEIRVSVPDILESRDTLIYLGFRKPAIPELWERYQATKRSGYEPYNLVDFACEAIIGGCHLDAKYKDNLRTWFDAFRAMSMDRFNACCLCVDNIPPGDRSCKELLKCALRLRWERLTHMNEYILNNRIWENDPWMNEKMDGSEILVDGVVSDESVAEEVPT